jgi:uncharacterized protein
MLDPSLAERLRRRPPGRVVMTQRWINLCFIHFTVDPSAVQSVLPPGLTVDTFPDREGRERAWIGFVPFEIRDLTFKPRGRIPSATSFLETNVRTYVHHDGKDPGVWFFSLDAASRLACKGARIGFKLPYWHAEMSYSKSGDLRTYQGKRYAPPRPAYKLVCEGGENLPHPTPGSLEFFLVERYLLYSYCHGKLHKGRVHHTPYPIQSLEIQTLTDALAPTAGFEWGPIDSALFSPEVDVDIFGLTES